jgi:hypothetical protein
LVKNPKIFFLKTITKHNQYNKANNKNSKPSVSIIFIVFDPSAKKPRFRISNSTTITDNTDANKIVQTNLTTFNFRNIGALIRTTINKMIDEEIALKAVAKETPGKPMSGTKSMR